MPQTCGTVGTYCGSQICEAKPRANIRATHHSGALAADSRSQEEGCPWTPRHHDAPPRCTPLRGGQRASRRRPKRVDAVRGRKRDVSLPGRRRPPRVGASGPLGSAGRDAPRERRRQPRGDHVRRGTSASAWGDLPRKGASVVSVHQCRTAPRGNVGVDRAETHRVHPTGRGRVR
mgnify:CR=1 FL=1